ncbi:MAG: hypothetical protein WCW16_04620 [Candidatus Magasanikbacteria bacterium]
MQKILLITSLVIFITLGCSLKKTLNNPTNTAEQFDYLSCNSDKDCTTTSYELHGFCLTCNTFPISKEGRESEENFRKNNPAAIACPDYFCLPPTYDVSCVESKCELKK